MPHQPFSSQRLERFRRLLGAGRGVIDLPGWRIVGLNSEVMGTGHEEEALQGAFISEVAAGAGSRRIAVFLHKPIFVFGFDDPDFDYWSVPPQARGALLPLLEHPNLRLVASGHLHLHRQVTYGRVAFTWAPALSFVVNPAEQPALPGARVCGALLHRLHADHVETVLLSPPGLHTEHLDEVRPQTYPRAAASADG